MKVLIVDDELHVIEGMRKHIPWQQWNVDDIQTAGNGLEAWEVFEQQKPDLIITDITMPRMNGLQFIKKIRQHNKIIPIIILSGYDDFAFAKEAIELDVSHYILKPIVRKEIMSVLQQIFDDMYSKLKQEQWFNHVDTYVNENVAALRDQFIIDLITRGIRFIKLDNTTLEMLDISESIKSGGMVMTLQIFPPTSQAHPYSSTDWQLLKYAVKNITEEIVAEHNASLYTTHFMNDRLSILWMGTDAQKLLEKVKNMANLIIKNIHRYLKLESNIGIGQWYPGIDKYLESYHQSITALQYGEYEGYQRIDWIDDLSSVNQAWPNYPIQEIQKITEAIMQKDSEQFRSLWGEFEQMNMGYPGVSIEFVQSVCIGLLNSIVIQLKETKSSISSSIALSALQHIQQMKTTKQLLIAKVQDTILEIMDSIQSNTLQGPERYVNFLIHYITQNYQQPITFAELAKTLHLNRVYLGNLFKKETGETFVNYLTKYRIDQAKKLMVSRNFMVFEVAEMVGYTDSAYFSRVFKNHTGMTPTEFLVNLERGN